jgi:hypothetical protein
MKLAELSDCNYQQVCWEKEKKSKTSKKKKKKDKLLTAEPM